MLDLASNMGTNYPVDSSLRSDIIHKSACKSSPLEVSRKAKTKKGP